MKNQRFQKLKNTGKRLYTFIKTRKWMLLLFGLMLAYTVARIPPVYNRLHVYWTEARSKVVYWWNPPDEAAFLPADEFQVALVVQSTLSAMTHEAQMNVTSTITPTRQNLTSPPTITPTPLPQQVMLEGFEYVDQHDRWNYCGPANLTMALSYWGWEGTRDDVAKVIKPGKQDPDLDFIQKGRSDVNVMPQEMVNYVKTHTYLRAALRIGGEISVLKSLIANGYPVVIEKGYFEMSYTGEVVWMGHYLFVTGYDDQAGGFIVQDAWVKPGENLLSSYEDFEEGWHSFNYTFFVLYPPDKEAEVFALMGPWADETWAKQHALELAEADVNSQQSGLEQFFSWFNLGSSHVALDEYPEAAAAYDYAFFLYNQFSDDNTQRPFRLMWYQVGPYWAYYYTGRYEDLINLANITLYDTISEPSLEESLYWRGLAYLSVGRYQDAVADFRQTIYLNPSYTPGYSILEQLGEDPDA